MKTRDPHPPMVLFALSATLLFLIAPTVATAQCGSPATSNVPSLFPVCPRGDVSVSIVVRDPAGNPCPGSTITLDVLGGPLCGSPLSITATTNNAGVATFSPRLGGHASTPVVATFTDASGVVIGFSTLVNSPDIDSNCVVNLADVSLLSQTFSTGIGIARVDYNFDGIVNLQDVTFFAQHYGH